MDFRPEGLIRVYEDTGRTAYKGGPDAPEWRDDDLNGVIQDSETEWAVPVGYVRNTKPVVKATFVITGHSGTGPGDGTAPPDVVTIKGIWPGAGLLLPEQKVTVGKDDKTVVYPSKATEEAVPDYVDSIETAGIQWQFQRTGDLTWRNAGDSSNQMYVTLATPVTSTPVYHTLISLSTRASWGAKDATTVVNKTYQQFTFRSIQAVMPAYGPPGSASATTYSVEQPLCYYKSWVISYEKTSELIQYGDGQCKSWVSFFRDSVKMHGDIPVQVRRVTPLNTGPGGDTGFAVTLWHFTDHKYNPTEPHPYLNVTARGVNPAQEDEFHNWSYKWHPDYPPDVLDVGGAPGQNVENPQSLFARHFIVAYDDGKNGRKLYDPSYGTGPFASFADWENESVFALIRAVPSGDGKLDLYGFRPNLDGADLQEGPS